jgi:hypothetical protein
MGSFEHSAFREASPRRSGRSEAVADEALLCRPALLLGAGVS